MQKNLSRVTSPAQKFFSRINSKCKGNRACTVNISRIKIHFRTIENISRVTSLMENFCPELSPMQKILSESYTHASNFFHELSPMYEKKK